MQWLKRVWGSAAAAARRFIRDRRGVSTVEYALIVVAVIAIVGVVAANLSGAFTDLFDDLTAEMNAGAADVEQAVEDGADP